MLKKKLTIAFVESATGGRVAADFSLIPQAGDFLEGGLICYDARLKESLLNVSKRLIEEKTPESSEVTKAIAHGLTEFIPATIHVGITGLTAPGGSETPEKPVGTIFIHCLLRNRDLFSKRIVFQGTPEHIVTQTVTEVAKLLKSHL